MTHQLPNALRLLHLGALQQGTGKVTGMWRQIKQCCGMRTCSAGARAGASKTCTLNETEQLLYWQFKVWFG